MSIIGPRPLLVRYLDRYNEEQHHRHDVRPGLTGYAQAHGRNAVSWEDKFAMDTGQRRLARNLLRDVVGRYVGNEPNSLFALEEIQKTAALMRFELERGNVDGFAKLLDYHWELSKKVDAGSSNTLIEQIFSSIEELIDGKLVCGAGGGGFLQAILKKGVTRQQVENRLNEVFMDSLVGVAECRLVWK